MDPQPSPQRAGGTLEAYRPRKTKNATRWIRHRVGGVNNRPLVRVRYALASWQWAELRWRVESDPGIERFSRTIADWRVA